MKPFGREVNLKDFMISCQLVPSLKVSIVNVQFSVSLVTSWSQFCDAQILVAISMQQNLKGKAEENSRCPRSETTHSENLLLQKLTLV